MKIKLILVLYVFFMIVEIILIFSMFRNDKNNILNELFSK